MVTIRENTNGARGDYMFRDNCPPSHHHHQFDHKLGFMFAYTRHHSRMFSSWNTWLIRGSIELEGTHWRRDIFGVLYSIRDACRL